MRKQKESVFMVKIKNVRKNQYKSNVHTPILLRI